MYAIFEDGSHQYRVEANDVISVDCRDVEPGAHLEFSKVLLVAGDGQEPRIGDPCVESAKVVGEVIEHFRDKKVLIQKFRRRKNYRRKKGHRQPYTMIKVTQIVTA